MPTTASISPFKQWAFIVLMLALTGFFVLLGNWQMHRLGEKEALIEAVTERLHQPPIAMPLADQWAGLGLAQLNFKPVSASGSFAPAQTIEVFTSLQNGNGPAAGPGYWIMTPFRLNTGGTVMVNRGFVPEAKAKAFANDPNTPRGHISLAGIVRPTEGVSMFTPPADPDKRLDWVRDPERLATQLPADFGPVAPFYLDLPATEPATLPQGGETVIEFPNKHFGYALTWYGFALVAPIMLLFWLWRQRHPKAGPSL